MTALVKPVHTATVNASSLALTAGTLTLDEAAVPYITGSLAAALDVDRDLAVDALTLPECLVMVRTIPTTGVTMGDLDALVGATMAGYQAAIGGGPLSTLDTLADVTTLPGETGTAPFGKSYALVILDRTIDYEAGEVTYSVASDEARAQRSARVSGNPRVLPAGSNVSVIAALLAQIGAQLVIDPTQLNDATILSALGEAASSETLAWTPGQSVWDVIGPILDACGARVAVTGRRWVVVDSRRQPHPDVLAASDVAATPATMTGMRERTSTAAWFDSAVIRYEWRNAAGVDLVAYDAYSAVTTPTSTYSSVVRRPMPRAGAAAQIVKRSQSRGRVWDTRGALHPQLVTLPEPGWDVSVTRPTGGDPDVAIVSRVDLDLAANTVTATTRENLA
ncbi:MAG: hypothetical protein FWF90_15625 [Promicromonosporaceae bacterium]|nr:hypothetical protein [Promicromonosporaceae bacterium]